MTTCHCGMKHAIPRVLYKAALLRAGAMEIWCPNGHSWVFRTKKQLDEEAEVRRERDRLRQQIAQKDDEIRETAQKLAKVQKETKRQKARAMAGVCSCCNRHFTDLQRHMASKHKEPKQWEVKHEVKKDTALN